MVRDIILYYKIKYVTGVTGVTGCLRLYKKK